MADPVADFEVIRKHRDAAVAKLSAIEAPVNARSNRLINKKNRGEALSPAEKAELEQNEALLIEVGHAKSIVGQIAIQQMNDSELLRDIRNKLEGITDNLKKTKAKLKKVGEVATAVAAGTEALVALGEKVLDAAGGKPLMT